MVATHYTHLLLARVLHLLLLLRPLGGLTVTDLRNEITKGSEMHDQNGTITLAGSRVVCAGSHAVS